MSLTEVRLRPAGPWRTGHRAGDRERVDVIYHSDALYSAVTHAMRSLGWLEDWLDATARAAGDPAVRFSSLFPFIGKTRLITPPRTVWPPANAGKVYLQGAKLVPLELIRSGAFDESRWSADGATECLVPAGAGAPFHVSMRSAAAVDRITGATEPHSVACLEFASNAGWWGVFDATDKTWEGRVKSAFRLLADSGFGGERSRGWGRAAAPEFSDASSLLPSRVNEDGAWWLLSVYSPDASDAVDWSRGEYAATQRGGWTDSQAGVAPKKQVRVIEEGSVLYAPSLRGRAVDVAPEGFAHPVYRAGFALAVLAPPEPAMRQQPVAAPEAVLEEVAIPAEFEAGVHHEPQGEPCDEPIHAEVPIPAEFEAGVHHEPHGEPCDEPIHAEVPIPAEFEAGIPVETPAEVAEEVEAEAEMVFEGAPPEPPVRAEAEPETTEADAHIGSPDEELL